MAWQYGLRALGPAHYGPGVYAQGTDAKGFMGLKGRELLKRMEELNIILDAKGDAVCITETTKVYICPFNEISASHAFKEGEGDRSLEYWYSIHT